MAEQEEQRFLTTITVREIKKGDEFPGPGGWVAVEDARALHDYHCDAVVQYRDGAIGTREWDDPNREIEVNRAL